MSKIPTGILTFRAPLDFIADVKAESEAQDVTISDVIRSRCTDEALKPLGKPVPSKRKKSDLKFSSVDPKLILELNRIGVNLNQIARKLNAGESVETLFLLRSIESQLGELVDAHRPPAKDCA